MPTSSQYNWKKKRGRNLDSPPPLQKKPQNSDE